MTEGGGTSLGAAYYDATTQNTMVFEASVAQNKVFDLDDHIKVLSLTEILDDVFPTLALTFPITDFSDFQLDTDTTEYSTTAGTYVATSVDFDDGLGGTIYDEQTLKIGSDYTGDVENVTNLYFTRANSGTPLFTEWASGYDNQTQGKGFELGNTKTTFEGWVDNLPTDTAAWFDPKILTDLGITAAAVDNYIQGVWIQDLDRDGNYEREGNFIKFFEGDIDTEGGGTSLGAAYYDKTNDIIMVYEASVAEDQTFDLSSYLGII